MRNSIAIVFFTILVLLFLFLKSDLCQSLYSGSNFPPVNPFTRNLSSLPYARSELFT